MKSKRKRDLKYGSPMIKTIFNSHSTKSGYGKLIEDIAKDKKLLKKYDELLADFTLVTGYETRSNIDVFSWGSNVTLDSVKLGTLSETARELLKKVFCFPNYRNQAEWFDLLRTIPRYKTLVYILDSVFIGLYIGHKWEYMDKLSAECIDKYLNGEQ